MEIMDVSNLHFLRGQTPPLNAVKMLLIQPFVTFSGTYLKKLYRNNSGINFRKFWKISQNF